MSDSLSTVDALAQVRQRRPLSTADALAQVRGQAAAAPGDDEPFTYADEPAHQARLAEIRAQKRRRDDSNNPLDQLLTPVGHSIRRANEATYQSVRRPGMEAVRAVSRGEYDKAGGAVVTGIGGAVFGPANWAIQAAPEPVRRGVERGMEAIDTHVAEPLSMGSETARAGLNIVLPAAAGHAVPKLITRGLAGGRGREIASKPGPVPPPEIIPPRGLPAPEPQYALPYTNPNQGILVDPRTIGQVPRVNLYTQITPEATVEPTRVLGSGAGGGRGDLATTIRATEADPKLLNRVLGATERAEAQTAKRAQGVRDARAQEALQRRSGADILDETLGETAPALRPVDLGRGGVTLGSGLGGLGEFGTEGLKKGGKAVAAAAKAVGTAISTNLDQLPPVLASRVRDVLELRAAKTQGAMQDLRAALGKVPKTERATLTRAVMEGREQGTPAQQQFRGWWNRSADALREGLTKAGVFVIEDGVARPIHRIENFFPQWPRRDVLDLIAEKDPATMQRLYEEGVKKQKAFDSPEQMDQFLQSYRDPRLGSMYAGTHRPRKFHWPDEMVEPDVVATLEHYLHRAIADGAEQSIFRYYDPQTMKPRGKMAQGDLGDIIASLPVGEQAAAKQKVLQLLHRDPAEWSGSARNLRDFNAIIGAANMGVTYVNPTTWAVQLTQPAMLNSLVGERIMVLAARDMRPGSGIYDKSVRAGAMRPITYFTETAGLQEAGPLGKLGEGAAKAANVAGAPMAATDAVTRMWGVAAAPHFAKAVQRQLTSGSRWQRRIAEIKLEGLDYTLEEIARVAAGDLGKHDMNVMAQRIVRRTSGEATRSERIPLAADPQMAWFFQGTGFSHAQARNSWRVAGKQLFQAGNPLPAIRLLYGTGAVGLAMLGLRNAIAPDARRPGVAQTLDDPDAAKVAMLAAAALHEGSFGGVVGDTAHAFAPNAQGRVDPSGFMQSRMVPPMARYGIAGIKGIVGQVSPPNQPGTETPKTRGQVFLETARDVSKNFREWERIGDRVFGRDTMLRDDLREASTKKGRPKQGQEDYWRRLHEALR